MTDMRVVVIINPVSGAAGRAGAAQDRSRLASSLLHAAGIEAEVRVTERKGHAYELARAALGQGASLVCAWGGDGTMNEVGRALAFGRTPLGIVPAGSGNGLARELGIPSDPAEALASALRTADRTIDAGEIDGRLFFNVAGIGLDAHIASRFPVHAHGPCGRLRYIVVAAGQRFVYQPADYTIEFDGGTLHRRALTVVFANSRQYGHGAVVAPLAEVDDGALDLVAIEPASLLVDLSRMRRMFDGTLHRAPGVTMTKVHHARIAAEAPMPFHVDGESVSGGRTLVVRVHPGALRVRA
jgi:diacylglycerol kinase (ATP)